jgi:SAM-dependent methyltransferase
VSDDVRRRCATVFGSDAEAYDRERPAYPAALVDALCARGGLTAGSRVVEIGCGTGKLTRALAARGLQIDAVDPSAPMLEIARRRVGADADVSFHAARFEDVDLPAGSFDAALSAAAFHWLDPRVSWSRAADLLRHDGLLGLLGQTDLWTDDTAHALTELRAALQRAAPDIAASWQPPRTLAAVRAGIEDRRGDFAEAWSWVEPHDVRDPAAAERFRDVRLDVAPVVLRRTADELIALLRTTSFHHRVNPEAWASLEDDIAALAHRLGGEIVTADAAIAVSALRV